MFGNGNGYDGYRMSNNARAAYASGEKPLSKWTKTAIIAKVAEIRPEAIGWLNGVTAATLRKNLLFKSSWHHTSSFYNPTDFYMLNQWALSELTEETVKNWQPAQKVDKTVTTYRANWDYLEWTGTRKHPKALQNELKNVLTEEHGCFYVAFDDNGNEILRKKIGSTGTYVHRISDETE